MIFVQEVLFYRSLFIGLFCWQTLFSIIDVVSFFSDDDHFWSVDEPSTLCVNKSRTLTYELVNSTVLIKLVNSTV